jgi:hypothetical protein
MMPASVFSVEVRYKKAYIRRKVPVPPMQYCHYILYFHSIPASNKPNGVVHRVWETSSFFRVVVVVEVDPTHPQECTIYNDILYTYTGIRKGESIVYTIWFGFSYYCYCYSWFQFDLVSESSRSSSKVSIVGWMLNLL